jgi:hypothetical protein
MPLARSIKRITTERIAAINTEIVVLIVRFFRYLSKRKNQLDRLEKKIDEINEQIKRDNKD